MPNLTDKIDEGNMLLRMMFYGAPKTRKTWEAGTAALANYNVVLLDGDHGYHVLTKVLPPEAQKRVTVFEIADKRNESTFALFMATLLSKGKVYWDETEKKVLIRPQSGCVCLDLEKLDQNTVLVLDSWTALTWSIAMRYAREHMIDLTDPQKQDQEGYAWMGSLATWMLTKLTTVNCHLIVIGHSTMYTKFTTDARGKRVAEWERMIMKSTSGPHAMTLSDKVSDILYFYNLSATATRIDTSADKDREGGSRILKPGTYKWEDLPMTAIFKEAGVKMPTADNPYLDFTITDEEVQTAQAKPQMQNATIEPKQNGPIKLSALSKLQGAKK